MGAQENAETVEAFNDAFNTNDAEAAIALCTPEIEIVNVATGDTYGGPEGIRKYFQYWLTAFPDAETLTKNTVADKDQAVSEFIGRGSHTGPLGSPDGMISPTGRTISVNFVSVNELRRAKINRMRLYFDFATVLRQLGVGPVPAGAPA
jgi:steroid delta-isomerase-like uncharacterized protein